MRTREFLRQSGRRRARIEEKYNPWTGHGSHLDRTAIDYDGTEVLLPDQMVDRLPWVRRAVGVGLKKYYILEELPKGKSWDAFRAEFDLVRLRYDPEFWFASCVKIKLDAESRERMGDVLGEFRLNRAQRIYLQTLYRLFFAGVPVRIILLKARQWGGSTLTQIFFAWVQAFWRKGWNIFVCALQMQQAAHIRQMYVTLAEEYPDRAGKLDQITLKGYAGQTNIKYVVESQSIIGITSIERPDSPRSFSIHMAHLSEVGLWKSTPMINAEAYTQAITGAVPRRPYTIIVEESTAKGVGTYYHQHWQAATATPPRSNYVPVFIAWFDIPKYAEALPWTAADRGGTQLIREWIDSWDEYERGLWKEFGCTLEQIYWYRQKLAEFKGKRIKMHSEFPSTPQEAFQSTGQRYFSGAAVKRIRDQVRKPRWTGRLKAKAQEGRPGLKDIRFVQDPLGELAIWIWPFEIPERALWWKKKHWRDGVRVARRYCGFADFGGKSDQADWSVLTIIDRLPMLWGGSPWVAARLRTHKRPDLFAWDCARLGMWYDEAMLAYEINRHVKDRGDDIRGYEPEWSMAVIDQIGQVYPNPYYRTDEESAGEMHIGGSNPKLGFHTNTATKGMIINVLDQAIDEDGYDEPDVRACDEFDTFEQKPDGRLGAVEGNKDDIVISTAGTLWLALSHMDDPVLIDVKAKKKKPRRTGAAIYG